MKAAAKQVVVEWGLKHNTKHTSHNKHQMDAKVETLIIRQAISKVEVN